MSRLRITALALVCVLLNGCRDERRDAARGYLQTHAPAGFAVVRIPDNLPIRDVSADTGEVIAVVRYRSTDPTIEKGDGFDMPAAQIPDRHLAELRGWALSSLPANAPLRARFLAEIADAHRAFPVKRIVTPAGTEVEALTTVVLRRANGGWQVAEMKSDATVPGSADTDPHIPLTNAPEVATRIAGLSTVADQLEAARAEYLATRKLAAERSREQFRAILRTAETFVAPLPDGNTLRLVVTRGLESADPAVVVLTVQGAEQSTARFTGGLEQKASGETVWRAAQITPLGSPSTGEIPAILTARKHPILTLTVEGAHLLGEATIDGHSV